VAYGTRISCRNQVTVTDISDRSRYCAAPPRPGPDDRADTTVDTTAEATRRCPVRC